MTVQRPPSHGIQAILDIMERLRSPEDGCSWDVAQTFATIAPYTIEEAYEVADACARDDMPALQDELGDLLFQVVFHAQMAKEAGAFDFNDVVTSICDKMVRRHPHVFSGGEKPDWESLKASERHLDTDESALAGVALGLPALMRAEKLQKRAARTGFDWPDQAGPRAKIDEEIAEIECVSTPDALEDEVGDLLFAVTNWARHLGVDPEAALRRANGKFEQRFREIERRGGAAFPSLTLVEMESLWAEVKRDQA